MCTAMQHLQDRIRTLEADTTIRKGQLMECILRDVTIQWEVIFTALTLRGRHRSKTRWRRAIVQENLRRPFPRGGARHILVRTHMDRDVAGEHGATPPGRKASCGARPSPPPCACCVRACAWGQHSPVVLRLSGVTTVCACAPSRHKRIRRHAFPPLEVWERFRTVFPVLTVYRAGWVASLDVSRAAGDRIDLPTWEALWQSGTSDPSSIGAVLMWPTAVLDNLDLLLPVARTGPSPATGVRAQRLWPDEPWVTAWIRVGADRPLRVARATVPFLRRTACLLHGFHLGGCSPRGVWEAIQMPHRM